MRKRTDMRLRQRLSRLERIRLPGSPAWWMVFVDKHGIVVDAGSVETRRWIGRHYSVIPKIGELIFGVEPLVVWGCYPDVPIAPGRLVR